jgi:hypothetical protein
MPYAGMGAGFIKNDGDLKAVYNIVVGTNLKVGKGILYTDFTRIFLNTISVHYGFV